MGFHHLALAVRDVHESHRFYTEALGFELVKVEVLATADGLGWARHLFYDTGNGELFALWDLRDPRLDGHRTAISTDLGLPNWVNHVAFAAADLEDLDARKDRLLAHGHDVVRIDHDWCTSIYADDPNGIMVEFSTSTRALTDADRAEAAALLAADEPPISKAEPPIEFFSASPDDAVVP